MLHASYTPNKRDQKQKKERENRETGTTPTSSSHLNKETEKGDRLMSLHIRTKFS